MNKFNTLHSPVTLLLRDNIDTDQIIPARFLRSTQRSGFGAAVFHDLRYNETGSPKEDFVLNQESEARPILIAGENFGCGSSREHAAWALSDHGFRAVLAPSFADIFYNNALNNGLLPVTISRASYETLSQHLLLHSLSPVTIDLEKQLWSCEDAGLQESFEVPAFQKHCLISGQDSLEYLLSLKDKINQYEYTNPFHQISLYS